MATNNINTFRKEDYPESPSWWDRAILNLNLLIDYIFALNRQMTANTTAIAAKPSFQTVTVTQTSASDSTTHPEHNTYNFTSTLSSAPSQLLLTATNSNNPVFTSPVWASWYYINGTVYVTAITGLQNSTQYTFTVTIFA